VLVSGRVSTYQRVSAGCSVELEVAIVIEYLTEMEGIG
jgi:hypothetical protein